MRHMVRVVFSFVTILLASCTLTQEQGSVTPVQVNADGAFLQTRLYAGGCIAKFKDEREFFPSIAGVVVPQLITKGLDTLGATLRKAGEMDIVTVSSRYNLDGDSVPICIQLVHGLIAPTQLGAKSGQLLVRGVDDATIDNLLKSQKIYLADKPRFFVELRLRTSKDSSGMALAASHIAYNAYVRGGGNQGGASRSLTTEIVFHGPGIATDDKTAVKAQLFLGELKPGTELLMINTKETVDQWESQIATAWFRNFRQVAENAKGKPVTVTASVFETRSENKLLLALADVFDGSKATIQEELEKTLLESKRREVEITDLTNERALLEKHYTSLVNAEGEVLTYCASAGDVTPAADKVRLEASQKARLAQLQANIDAVAAGIEQPYPNEKLVKLTGGTVPENCEDSTTK